MISSATLLPKIWLVRKVSVKSIILHFVCFIFLS